ncbi:uncharacterized protein LOC135398071 [Ornithodoros turicata]|uniref:uncharacterized protein LOC135398071 n=1 Tax=Ornithodoros turicata TaxID=34597 RepID=UPI00313A384B
MGVLKIFAWVYLVSMAYQHQRVYAVRVAKMWANTSALTVSWKSVPGGGFCLCYATAEHFQRGLSFFDCIPYHRESRCDLARFTNCTQSEGASCAPQTVATSTMTGLRPGTTYAFCTIDSNPATKTGYDKHALCTRTWTLDAELHFRTRVYSHYMVGLEWTVGNETENLFNVRLCVSRDGCQYMCKDNLVEVRREKFVDWVDLSKERVRLQVRRTDGVILFERKFNSKKGVPDRPCDVTALTMGPSTIRVSWVLEDQVDGFLVRRCCWFWCKSKVHLEPRLRYVFLDGLTPWTHCTIAVQSFRAVNNTKLAMSDPGEAEAMTSADPKQLLWCLALIIPLILVCTVYLCKRKKRHHPSEVWQVRYGRPQRGATNSNS